MIALYNTLSSKVENLSAANKANFGIYCCGPTVYGPAHIGNFRTYVVQDLVCRLLLLNGYSITYVRNVTDVDDKTIAQSQKEGVSLKKFTNFWLEKFNADCGKLNLLEPNIAPKATEHIKEQIELIQALEKNGFAYATEDGSVYFRISAFKNYGRLSKLDGRQLRTNNAAMLADEYSRESFGDFALWKGRKPEDGDTYWESPWGQGRPGWHTECIAMAKNYLGETIDLHAGGIDLCFPHHENEIAQAEAIDGNTFSRHWLHVTHLLVEGQKMSKSLGNLYTLSDIEAKGYTPQALRYVLMGAHYRQPLNFTFDDLNAATVAVKKIVKRLSTLEGYDSSMLEISNVPELPAEWEVFGPVWEALNEDLNIPKALGRFFTSLQDLKGKSIFGIRKEIRAILYAFGIDFAEIAKDEVVEITEEIKALAEARWQAKKDRRFEESDRLREEILAAGWNILDSKDSYKIVKITK